jgi:hypothetical protein
MALDGWEAEVIALARATPNVLVRDVDDGPLVVWLLTSGLTQEEAALIQPGYYPPTGDAVALSALIVPGASLDRDGYRYENLQKVCPARDFFSERFRRPFVVRHTRNVRAANKEFRRRIDRTPGRQHAVVAHVPGEFHQVRGFEIEHRPGIRLITAFRVIATQQQQVLHALRRRTDQIAGQRNPVPVAAGHLQNGLVAIRGQYGRRCETAHRRPPGRGVGYVDCVDTRTEHFRLGQQRIG